MSDLDILELLEERTAPAPPPPTTPQPLPPTGLTGVQLTQQLSNPSANVSNYAERLAFDSALCLENNADPEEELPLKYQEITAEQVRIMRAQPVFMRAESFYRDYISKNGITFKIKAGILADAWLTQMNALMHDVNTPSPAKVQLFTQMTKLAGLEPERTQVNVNAEGGNGFTLNLIVNNNKENPHKITADRPVLDVIGERIKEDRIKGEQIKKEQKKKTDNTAVFKMPEDLLNVYPE